MFVKRGKSSTERHASLGVIFHYVSSQLGDQCFWAKRCAALGVGPSKTIRVRDLSEDALVVQLHEVLEDDQVVQNARLLGELFLESERVEVANFKQRRALASGKRHPEDGRFAFATL